MQLVYETGLYFSRSHRDAPNVLVMTVLWPSVWSVDPWWTLAQTGCCARLLAAGRWWSRHRQRSEGRFFDVTRGRFGTKRLRFRRRPLAVASHGGCCASRTRYHHVGGRACGCHVVCEVDRDPFSLCRQQCHRSSASSSLVNTLCPAVMEGARAVGNESGLRPMCFATEKAIERWRRDKSSSRTRHFPCECGRVWEKLVNVR